MASLNQIVSALRFVYTETIGERLERDLAALRRPLPPAYDACEKEGTRVSSLSLVRYWLNDYSVPTSYEPRLRQPGKVRDQPLGHRLARANGPPLIRGRSNLFDALAGPFAGRGLAVILGLEAATDDEMIRWSQALINGAGNFSGRSDLFEKSDNTNAEIDRCIALSVERHRREKGPSALSVMVNALDPIPMSQIIANIKICLGGGLNEPRDALLTVVCGLLSDPDQLDQTLRSQKWGAAFEEGVRWCAPVQVSSRIATADTEIRGLAIRQGEIVMTVQASANHDEEIYIEPERFNVTRKQIAHQSFGNGPHFCLGANLARRMIGDIMLPLLFERFPKMSLIPSTPVSWEGFGFRGPVVLPVKLN